MTDDPTGPGRAVTTTDRSLNLYRVVTLRSVSERTAFIVDRSDNVASNDKLPLSYNRSDDMTRYKANLVRMIYYSCCVIL